MTLPPAVHRTIVVVDVEGFTDSGRLGVDHLAVRGGMYDVLNTAFTDSAIDFDSCEHEDRGDGVLVLVPPTVSKSVIADRLPDRLVAALRRYNSTRVPTSRFRLRVAMHSGDIRRDGAGWAGQPVIDTFRIIDADAVKTALRESDRMIALIVSDHFYTDVIQGDPGTVPESYTHVQAVTKNFSKPAWLRLLGHDVSARPATEPTARPEVLGVVQPADEQALRPLLHDQNPPRMSTLLGRAAQGVIPLPRHETVPDAWAAFQFLSDFNADVDGIPPSMLFLQLIAAELDDDTGERLRAWIADQSRRLRRGRELADHPVTRTPVPDEPHLHLTIMVEPDSIDPSRCLLSSWRQDDPLSWPPVRGPVREVEMDELEYRVDEIILDAEGAWADKGISAAVEFLLPRTLLSLPVGRWSKEHGSGKPRPLSFDYRVSIRSLERMRTRHWHRAWHVRWDSMLENPTSDRMHYSGSAKEHPIDAVLSDPHWVGLVMAKPPSPQPEPGAAPDELMSALRSGLPVIFWHPDAGPEDLRKLIAEVLPDGSGLMDRLRKQKLHDSGTVNNNSLVRDLVVMWDDPKRVIVLDQPVDPTEP